MAYADEQGTIVAEYAYDAFGRTIEATGSMADAFRHRFSTKYYDAETGLYYYGYRFYDPELMRWFNRDPTRENGGWNLYAFVVNDPCNKIDALGLEWTVNRNGFSQADADCKCDNVEELAKRIGLEVADYQKWLSQADGHPLPSSATEVMKKRKFRIPNIVYAYWAGDVGWTGKTWVNWNSSIIHLKNLGFATIAHNHTAGSSYVLQNILQVAASSRALHGLYYWGHGWAPYPSYGLTTSGGDDVVYYRNVTFADGTAKSGVSLPYKMALGLIYACDSNSGKPALFSGAPGGIWHGYSGALYPIIPFRYHVNSHIHHGDQETK
ncbi:MAG: RHS repeat-associated core domain-containing protein [Kiritimatiellia bacterium]